ncbi:MAG: minor capsid protein [Silvanigrellaceae bacterium]|nr:minor capsid protein [Silvanigrellaceae bacterium]
MNFIEYASRKTKPNLRISLSVAPPIHLERQFQREILSILNPALLEINRIVLKKLPQWIDYYSLNRDGFFDENENDKTNEVSSWFDKIQKMLVIYLSYKGIKTIVKNFSHKIIKYSKDSIDKQMNKLFRLNPFYMEDNLNKSRDTWIDRNIKNISDIPKNYVNKIQNIINSVIDQSKVTNNKDELINNFKSKAEELLDKNENTVSNLARDQVNSLEGEATMILQKEIGIKKFGWCTCRDEIVRPTHRALEGQVCEWDNLPKINGKVVWPGSEWACRCKAKPII